MLSSAAASGRVSAVGAISRFTVVDEPQPADRTVLVMSGAGGADHAAFPLEAARNQAPEWTWDVMGPGSWTNDPWSRIRDAAVIVTHAGQNALAEVAAARRPAIVIPQSRPFEEQRTTATVLANGGWPAIVAEGGTALRVGRPPVRGRGARRHRLGLVERRPRRGTSSPNHRIRGGEPVTSVGLVTIAHGRHEHLTRQYEALASSTVLPDATVLVGMDDPGLVGAAFRAGAPPGRRGSRRSGGVAARGSAQRWSGGRHRCGRGGARVPRCRLPACARARGGVCRCGHRSAVGRPPALWTGRIPAARPCSRVRPDAS